MNRAATAPLLIVGAVAVAYLAAFAGIFQFDDYNVIVDNPAVHSWAGWLGDLGGIRPLLKLTYTLNWTSGLGVFGFHLFNVTLHAANAVLVYWLFARFSEHRGAALLAALLFAVHPVQTEAVTYISGRSTSLMAAFYLGSLLAYARGRETGSNLLLHLVSPLLFVLAFLTKETAVTLPLALVLWEGAGPIRSRTLRGQVVHWALLGAIAIFLLVHPGYARSLVYGLDLRSLHDNLLSQINGVWYLLTRIVWPVHLNIDPALPVLTAWSWALAGKALVLLALFAAGVASLRRRPWLAFGILWFFLHLLPTNSFAPRRDVANERQLYLAAGGLFFAGSVALCRLWAEAHGEGLPWLLRWPLRWPRVAAALLLVTLGVLTTLRNRDYRSEIVLWEAVVREAPHNARAYNNLGYAYASSGDFVSARAAYVSALRIRPDHPKALNNLRALE